MNEIQEEALRFLCGRYNVEFKQENFQLNPYGLPEGYVAGWIGAFIYVGCAPDGAISS